MKWQWRHIAALLCLLSFPGVLVFWGVEAPPRENSLPANAVPGEEGGYQQSPRDTLTPGPYPYIINEVNKCPEGKPAPFLVLLILTEADQVKTRNAIRQTWGNEGLAPGLGVIRLFLLGVKEGELGRLQQKTLESESLSHHDIVQQDFLDTFNNLTIKTLMGMNWVAMHCPRASYVMKTDSDVLVNTDYLIHQLLRPELQPKTNYITGYIIRGGRPIRAKGRTKYHMPRKEYPNKRYPGYCSGMGYVFSGDMAAKVYRASLSIPLLRFEDVYVGVCLDRLRIKPTPPPIKGLFNLRAVPYSDVKYNNMVAIHRVSPRQFLQYWPRMQSYKLSVASMPRVEQ